MSAEDGKTEATSTRCVLIVDDEEPQLFAMARYFRRIGCEVVTASRKAEAEVLLGKRGYDLVILDLALTSGGREGLDLLCEVRRGDRRTPVMVLSALIGPEVERQARKLGADAVLTKPQPLSEVVRIAVQCMSRAVAR